MTDMTDDMIERVARAIGLAGITTPEHKKDHFEAMARAAIKAMLPVEARCPHCESWFKLEDIQGNKQ